MNSPVPAAGRYQTVPPDSNAAVRPETASDGATGAVVSTWTSRLPTDSTLPTASQARNFTVVVDVTAIAPA